MKKKLIFITALLLAATVSFAQTTPRYRGFVEGGFGPGQFNGSTYLYRQWVSDISTTHGCQITPQIFIGAGASWIRAFEDAESFFPVYAAARYTLTNVNVRPYIEGRLGVIAANSVWKEKVQKPYVSGSLGLDLLNHSNVPNLPFEALQVGGRLNIFGLHNGKGAFNGAIYLALAF